MQISISDDSDRITIEAPTGLFYGIREGRFTYDLSSVKATTAAAYDERREQLFLFNSTGFIAAFTLRYEDETFMYLNISPNGKCLFLVTYVDYKVIRHRVFTITDNSLEVETQKDLKEKISQNLTHKAVFISNVPECIGFCDKAAYSYYSKALETEGDSCED